MARERFDHAALEKAAQEKWEELRLHEADLRDDSKDPYYLLFEFPYPSGDLHIGHWYAYALTDIYARMLRAQGKNVLFPIGFDAFGLPAENAAMKQGADPKEWTYQNMEKMRSQIRSIGSSVDWSKEVVTCDPSYYKWTQWLFAKLYEHDLAYRAEAPVKWCPKDQTVLANEQVIDGKCERCDTEVEEKKLTQWFMRITTLADRLLSDLDALPWREDIKDAQRAWIGKSDGARLFFPLQTNVTRLLILHGKGGSVEGNFLPWLADEARARGITVEIPNLPNPTEPDEEEQAAFVEASCVIDENTAIVGHSFGGNVALRLLSRGHKVAQLITAGTPISGSFIDGKERPTVTAACLRGYEWDNVRANSNRFTVLFDTGDKVVPQTDGKTLADNLGVPVQYVASEEAHFCGKEEPFIRNALFPRIEVFTTRPDTVFGATYVVLAPEHPLVATLLSSAHNADEVRAYVAATAKKTERERSENKEKTGVRIEGVNALNPATKEEIPVYVADYVLATYGTGAVMAVPSHDERDHEFAKRYDLPMVQVVEGDGECYGGDGALLNSGAFTGRNNREAFDDIVAAVGGAQTINYRIRDWLVSRQRYWGCPIPVVYDPEGKLHVVPAEHLPWLLPEDVDFTPSGKPPLASSKELHERVTRIFGEGWTPEYDTLDTFVDSSWYYLRYLDPKDDHDFSDKGLMKKWLPVHRYSGGSEHTTMHLLYARFFHKALYDLALVPTPEPFHERYNRGLILGTDGQKMSKRWGNVVNPDEMLRSYGADAVRCYLAFIGPYNEPGHYPWKLDGVEGMRRFLDRVYTLSENVAEVPESEALSRIGAKTVAKVTEDGDRFKFNTALSALMVLVNALEKEEQVAKTSYLRLLQLLAPFAPHLTEHLHEKLGEEGSLHAKVWPVTDETLLRDTEASVVVQIAGKRRGEVVLPVDASEEEALMAAKAIPAVAEAYGKGEPKRVVYVPGRILNLVF